MADPQLAPFTPVGTDVRLTACVYCGEVADTHDHVIPRSYCRAETHCGRHRSAKRQSDEWTVPACSECNQSLGSMLLLTVPRRATYLLKRFKRKWGKIIRLPNWDEYEIEGTRGRFRRSVSAIGPTKGALIARLQHLEMVSEMDDDYLRP